jgi:hypothetical protein
LEIAFDRHDLGRLVLERARPCSSPTKICTGATKAAIHIAIEKAVRTAGPSRPFSKCQADAPPTTSAVVR